MPLFKLEWDSNHHFLQSDFLVMLLSKLHLSEVFYLKKDVLDRMNLSVPHASCVYILR